MKHVNYSKTNPKVRNNLGKPRKNALPIWRRVWFGGIFVSFFTMLVLYGGYWLISSGWANQTAETIKWKAISLLSKTGFKLKEILVVGRLETSQKSLRKAMRLDRGAPILTYDLEAARLRVEALPWIRHVSIKRMLPETILVSITESRPLAIWQNDGKFCLIDTNGNVIEGIDFKKFNSLMLVVGQEAPNNTAELFALLETDHNMQHLVKAAIWVGGRRWNLRMKGEINVQLPEKNAAAAWARLARYERIHQILRKNVQTLDLRISDRVIIRKRRSEPAVELLRGQET